MTRGGRQKFRHPNARDVSEALASRVSEIHGVPVSALIGPGRPGRQSFRISRARMILTYVCHVGLGLSENETAECMMIDRRTVQNSLARVEDMRDDEDFDELVSRHESVALTLRSELLPIAAVN